MRTTYPKPQWWVIAVFVIALLAAAGLVMAQGGDDGVYTGCLNPGGAIHSVAIGTEPLKPCPDGQMQISWNEQGPPGLPSGLSEAYQTNEGDVPLTVDDYLSDRYVDVAQLDLPTGNYVTNATLGVSYFPGGLYEPKPHASVDCMFAVDTSEGRVNLSGFWGTTVVGQTNLAITFGFPLADDSTVILSCRPGFADTTKGDMVINRTDWTAIKVDTLTQQ